jgi:hypothetical protein
MKPLCDTGLVRYGTETRSGARLDSINTLSRPRQWGQNPSRPLRVQPDAVRAFTPPQHITEPCSHRESRGMAARWRMCSGGDRQTPTRLHTTCASSARWTRQPTYKVSAGIGQLQRKAVNMRNDRPEWADATSWSTPDGRGGLCSLQSPRRLSTTEHRTDGQTQTPAQETP